MASERLAYEKPRLQVLTIDQCRLEAAASFQHLDADFRAFGTWMASRLPGDPVGVRALAVAFGALELAMKCMQLAIAAAAEER